MTAPGYHVMIPFLTTVKDVQTTLQTDEGKLFDKKSNALGKCTFFSKKYSLWYKWWNNDLL
jgi:hypothetical protein